MYIECNGKNKEIGYFLPFFTVSTTVAVKQKGSAIKMDSDEANIMNFQMNKTKVGVPMFFFGPEDK